MSSRQFGFFVGLALAVIWAGPGFLVMIAAAVAGLVGYVVARVVDNDLDLREALSNLGSGAARQR
ncbi:L-asparagine transporter-like permease [Allocatelliglobosispora scoriae]|uniref:L-asparagine transporter-like permease n=1 Tax=Allocatelliglobosispora scoriae TaxID=643052 RepID=A0A841BYJ0_9ACTN|nr:hypothetical protein [Allocatelliglobosispora scoriae]MBB5874217.1 L-asparagine transporter-like permease [Allocatelliglobosispora scoriae]